VVDPEGSAAFAFGGASAFGNRPGIGVASAGRDGVVGLVVADGVVLIAGALGIFGVKNTVGVKTKGM